MVLLVSSALAATSITVVIFLALMLWSKTTKKPPIKDWPLVGMLPGILSNMSRIHDYATQVLLELNHTAVIKGPKYSGLKFILTSDPENIHYILSTKYHNFNKGSDFKDIFEVLGDGIITADDDSWKMQRRLFHLLFNRRDFFNSLVETACFKVQNGVMKILDLASKSGMEVEMQDLCQRFTFDVACISLFGSDLNALSEKLPEVPFAKALGEVEEVVLIRHTKPRTMWKFQQWIQLGVERKGTKALKIIDDFIYQQISSKRELNDMSNKSIDMLSMLMEEMSPKPSDKFLRDSVMNILSAARDSTGTALTWFFYLVSTNPLIESKLLEELELTFQMKPGEPWKFPSISDLNKLVYLQATLYETMRLYPPVPFNHKASIEPDILPSGHLVDKETRILISIYAMGRMQDIWGADAAIFRPERWISKTNNIIDVPSYKYNVFSAGPRTCVGKELSLTEMKILASAVIWRYKFRISEASLPVIPATSIILHMKQGLKVNVSIRNERD